MFYLHVYGNKPSCLCFFLSLSSFGVVLRFCTSRRCDSSWSSIVIVLSWGCSSCVVVALLVMTFSSLSLKSSAVCVVVRRVGCGWVESVFLVCLERAHRVLVPVKLVVTAAALFLCRLSRCVGISVLAITVLIAFLECRSVPSHLHLCRV